MADIQFDEHVKNILKRAGSKLTALARMSNVLTFSKLRLLLKSFVQSQFAYCPLIWMFCSRTLNNRINKLQERALRILYKDDISTFAELLDRDKSITVHDHNIKLLAKEMYKVVYNILPNTLGEFLSIRDVRYNLRHPSIFLRENVNSTYHGSESIRILGPKIWELLPESIRSAENLFSFQEQIKKWKVEHCPCRLCKDFVGGVGFL